MILKYQKVIHFFKIVCFFFCFYVTTTYAQSYSHDILKSHSQQSFIIQYSPLVPDSVKPSIEYAVSVWEQYIFSDVPIVIEFSWRELASNVNAFARPTEIFQNLSGLPFSNLGYPVCLAEKFVKQNLNSNSPDIEIVINSTLSWHLDSVSPPSPQTRDLITIVLHEIAHGLGFIGNLVFKNGSISIDNIPLLFDSYMYYTDSIQFLSLLQNPQVSQDSILGAATSKNLIWKGPYAKAFLGYYPPLYAPTSFNHGSTFYHFDEDFYPAGTVNALMTPRIASQEYIHDPGIATIAVLADIGWTDYFMQHTNIQNHASVSDSVFFSLMFHTDYIDTSFVELVYSFDNGKNFVSENLSYNEDSLVFTGFFEPYPFERTVRYGFRTRSLFGDTISFPAFFPEYAYEFFVGEDIIPPVISHIPPIFTTVDQDFLRLRATITDNFMVDSAYVRVFIGRNDFSTMLLNTTIAMQEDMFGYYVDIPLHTLSVVHDDQIAYNIFAVDGVGNISSFLVPGDYQIVTIFDKPEPLRYFVTDFEDESIADSFILDRFTISLEDGFSSKALHTEHPYVSSFIDRQYVQYIAELRNPIIIAENPAIMEFDQVVLVEPSEPGVDYYTMFGFWDYVVVEATKDRASGEWHPLGKNGYDSRLHPEWLETFYSALIPDNNNSSIAVGTEEMYKRHTINLLENKYFRTQDTIFIRFRLQSDYNRHGWGWAIDNLSIQSRLLSVDNQEIERKECIVFPNPCYEYFCLKTNFEFDYISIYSITGNMLLQVPNSNTCFTVSSLTPGLYVLKIHSSGGEVYIQTLIKH